MEIDTTECCCEPTVATDTWASEAPTTWSAPLEVEVGFDDGTYALLDLDEQQAGYLAGDVPPVAPPVATFDPAPVEQPGYLAGDVPPVALPAETSVGTPLVGGFSALSDTTSTDSFFTTTFASAPAVPTAELPSSVDLAGFGGSSGFGSGPSQPSTFIDHNWRFEAKVMDAVDATSRSIPGLSHRDYDWSTGETTITWY